MNAHRGTRQTTRYLTVREAAARVERTTRTIEAWIHDDGLEVTVVDRLRYVDEDKLLTILRAKLINNPSRKRCGDI